MRTSNRGLHISAILTTPMSCSVHRRVESNMGLFRTATIQLRNTLPFLRPVREIVIGFAITGYLIYKIPISGTSRSQYCGLKLSVTMLHGILIHLGLGNMV